MDVPASVVAALEGTGVPYRLMECDPDFADTAAFCDRYGVAPEDSANTILVASRRPEGHVAACVVLATTRLDVNRTVRQKLGVKKVSFASADLTRELTGMLIGGVTPFGLASDIPVWVDAAVMERPEIVLGAGSRSAKVVASPEIVTRIPGTEVVAGLAHPFET